MKPWGSSFGNGVWVAIGVCATIAVNDLALAPLYVRGYAQGLLSHLGGVSHLLALPGLVLAIAAGVRQGHHTTAGAWVFILAANFVLYVVGVRVAIAALKAAVGSWRRRRKSAAARPDGVERAPRVSRRRALAAGAGALAAAGVGYPLVVATRRYEVTHRAIAIEGLPAPLSGLRLVQITDVHHGPWIPLSHVRDVVAAANALEPDLVLLTGDYVHRSPAYIEPVVKALAGLRAKIGVVAVLGNHDWWEDGPRTQRAFTRAGIPLIDNARRFLTNDCRLVGDEGTEPPTAGLCIAGVGDYYEDAQRYDDALGGVPAGMPRLLLSHNPDVAEDPAFRRSGHRVDLMISGHTHGGQIYVPGLGTPIVPSRYGQKYARGLVQGPACRVFVSRGVGHTVLPVRVGIRPELAVLQLVQA